MTMLILYHTVVGKSTSILKFVALHKRRIFFMYDVNKTLLLIKQRARECGVSTGMMLSELGISKNTLSSMSSRGSWPNIETIARISDYLDCSIDYLLGRQESTNIHINSHNQTSVKDSTVQINSDTTADGIENEMIAQFRSLPFSSKVNVMNCIQKESEKNVKA